MSGRSGSVLGSIRDRTCRWLDAFLMSGLLRLNKVDDPPHANTAFISAAGFRRNCNCRPGQPSRDSIGHLVGWEIVGLLRCLPGSVAAPGHGCCLTPLWQAQDKDAQERQGIDAAKIKEQVYDFSTPAVQSVIRTAAPLHQGQCVLTPSMDRNNTLQCVVSAIRNQQDVPPS